MLERDERRCSLGEPVRPTPPPHGSLALGPAGLRDPQAVWQVAGPRPCRRVPAALRGLPPARRPHRGRRRTHRARGRRLGRDEPSNGPLSADRVVIATGVSNVPFIPDWPGADGLDIVHSAAYRNASPYRGRRVLVVGTGNSGAEIAVDLAEGGASEVLLVGADATRHRPARHARRAEPAVRDRELASADRRRRPDCGRDPPGCDPRSRGARATRA